MSLTRSTCPTCRWTLNNMYNFQFIRLGFHSATLFSTPSLGTGYQQFQNYISSVDRIYRNTTTLQIADDVTEIDFFLLLLLGSFCWKKKQGETCKKRKN